MINIKKISLLMILFFIILLFSGCTQNNVITKDYKWHLAMDLKNVYASYGIRAYPTSVIIDINGKVIKFLEGMHYKEDLQPFIEQAVDGSATNFADSVDFNLVTLNEEEFTLSDQIGKAVLIDFMYKDCPHCVTQMPELKKIKQEFGDDLVIISIDVNLNDKRLDIIDKYGAYIIY